MKIGRFVQAAKITLKRNQFSVDSVAAAAACWPSELRTDVSDDLLTKATSMASTMKAATRYAVILFITRLDLPPNAVSLLPPKTPPRPVLSSLWIAMMKMRRRLTITKRTRRIILKTAIFLPTPTGFSSINAVDDWEELLKCQRRPTNKRTVYVFAGHELADVGRLH